METGSPGYAFLVSRNKRIIAQGSKGFADLASRTPVNSLSNFRMASVSKQFTAMVMLMLAEKKFLNLNDPLRMYFADCCEAYQTITIKQLLTHTSGIWDYEALIPTEQKKQVLDADTWLLSNAKATSYFSPGKKFKYSNTGFCVLTRIAEKVTGTSYEALIAEMLFKPLGMRNSKVYTDDAHIPNRALGYAVGVKGFLLNDQSITSATKGDGCVYTSVADYVHWHHSFYHHSFISKELFQEAVSPLVVVSDGVGYGYGWFSAKEKDGSRCFFHSGETSGFMNMVYHNLEKELMIIVFSNRNDSLVGDVFEELADQQQIQIAFEAENAASIRLFEWLSQQYG